MKNVILFIVLTSACLASTNGATAQETRRWTNSLGGVWDDPTNWNTGQPTSADNALFDLDDDYTIALTKDEQLRYFQLLLGNMTMSGGNQLNVFEESLIDSGSMTLSGIGTSLMSSSDFRVGDTGDGILNINSAALVTNVNGIVGGTLGGSGTVNVTGQDSTWNMSNLYLGNSGTSFDKGKGHIVIGSGARVDVGAEASSFIGAGLNLAGGETEGNLLMRNGSTMSVSDRIAVGTEGNLFVSGEGTRLTTNAGLGLVSSTALVRVEEGGLVQSHSGSVIFGDLFVEGENSKWEVQNKLTVGSGRIDILAGGEVAADSLEIGVASIPFGDPIGVVNVLGTNSRLAVTNELKVGGAEIGALNIFNGGQVSSDSLLLHFKGSVGISGNGSMLSTDSIDSYGRLEVLDGGLLTTNNATIVNSVISGAETRVSVSGTLNNRRNLLIEDGAQVASQLGVVQNQFGLARIEGAGSKWFNQNLYLGTSTGSDDDGGIGNGLNITTGGQVIVGDDPNKSPLDSLVVSDSEANGNLILRHGAQLVSDADGVIGLSAGTNGNVIVNGFFKEATSGDVYNSSLILAEDLSVGDAGNGFLEVRQSALASADNATVGRQAGSFGNVLVSNTDSTMNIANQLSIGHEGFGSLDIENAGQVNADTGLVGSGSSGVGNVEITGTSSAWKSNRLFLGSSDGLDDQGIGNVDVNAGGQLLIGDDFEMSSESQLIVSDSTSTAELAVRNGSTLVNDGVATIGRSADSIGSVVLSGANSRWDNSGTIMIGAAGKGTLSIEDGANLKTNGFAGAGVFAGSTGNVTVSGPESNWNVAETLVVGEHGTGRLDIQDQGLVMAKNAFIVSETGNGETRISGPGSELRLESALLMSGYGKSRLFIEDGGLASNSIGSLNGADVIATISGSNSRWVNTQSLFIDSTAKLIVEDAGFVSGLFTTVRAEDGINIRGVDSEFFAQTLNIGGVDSQTVGIRVEAGGKLTSTHGNIAIGSQTNGLVVVRDAGSTWDSNAIQVGSLGSGELNIENQGVVNSGGGFVGRYNTGQVTIDGEGSQWNVDQQIQIGWGAEAQGFFTVTDGGYASARTTSIGSSFSATGTLTIDGLNSVFETEQFSLGSYGTGTVLIDHSGQLITENSTLGSTSSSLATVNVQREGNWHSQVSLDIGRSGPSNVNIASDASVTVGTDGRTTIQEFGSVFLDGGRFEFGTTDLESFARISGNSGSLAGGIDIEGYNHISTLTLPSVQNLDVSEVLAANAGVIYGSGSTTMGVQNKSAGEIRTLSGQWARFGGVGNTNAGEINNFGGLLEFENDFTNGTNGFVGGRGQFIAGGGISNQGVMAFSGGNTDILGDVLNSGDGQIVTSGFGLTTFFDDVVHNGAEIRTSNGSATVFLGEFSGVGEEGFTGIGDVFFEGDLRPGNSPDILSFEGNVFLGTNANTLVELAGFGLGEFDQLDIAGDLYADGELSVSLIDGFKLHGNQEFLIADVDGGVFGQFNGLAEGSLLGKFGNQSLFISYQRGDGNDIALFTAIPEPSSGFIALFVVSAMILRRRRSTLRHNGCQIPKTTI